MTENEHRILEYKHIQFVHTVQQFPITDRIWRHGHNWKVYTDHSKAEFRGLLRKKKHRKEHGQMILKYRSTQLLHTVE